MSITMIARRFALIVLLSISACLPYSDRTVSIPPSTGADAAAQQTSHTVVPVDQRSAVEPLVLSHDSNDEQTDNATVVEIWPGSGQRINRASSRRNSTRQNDDGNIILNFENTELVEVLDTVLGEILNVNYLIDPKISGSVFLTTSKPIARDAVLPTLETILRLNGAVLTVEDNVYMVLPEARALVRAPKPRFSTSADGYQVLVVPVNYVEVRQIESVLKTLLPDKSILLSDSQRNLLVLAGSSSELRNAIETIAIFDTDQMRGMSVGLFTLKQAEASSVKDEVEAIMGVQGDDGGTIGKLVRIISIDRLNALIVITPQQHYLERVGDWIKRLDHTENVDGLSMYVYPVQNGRAENLAELLNNLFTDDRAGDDRARSGGSSALSPSPARAAGAGAQPPTGRDGGALRIIADTENNSLVIMAGRSDYSQVKSALRKLDVLPLQVLVEATIVEISLTDELSYGLQWFFKNGIGKKGGLGELFPLTVDPSFSYSVSGNASDVRAVLSLLAADSRLNVISSPSLVVRDNQTATIKVGDQVPVRTSETTSLATSGNDALVTSTIQYRDTGVLLEVTPRVNQGGMVSLEITQDVNDVDQTTTSEIDSPTIIQRRISTSVAVQSGETLVLGGLIRENKSTSEAGVPGLRKVPVLGRLFGSRVTNNTRTELLVLITPTAIETVAQARDATLEMKSKMSGIQFATEK